MSDKSEKKMSLTIEDDILDLCKLSDKELEQLSQEVANESLRRIHVETIGKLKKKKGFDAFLKSLKSLMLAINELPKTMFLETELLGIQCKLPVEVNGTAGSIANAITDEEYGMAYFLLDAKGEMSVKLPSSLKAHKTVVKEIKNIALNICDDGRDSLFWDCSAYKSPEFKKVSAKLAQAKKLRGNFHYHDIIVVCREILTNTPGLCSET